MPQLGMLRKIDTNAFSSANMVPTKIPIIQYGRDLALYLKASVTTGTSPTVHEDAPFSIASAIDLVAAAGLPSTPSGSLHRMSAMDMYVLNAFETGNWGFLQRMGTSNTTTYAIAGLVVMPFSTFPVDSLNLLPHPAFTNLELDVTWGALANLGTNLGSFSVNPTLDLYEVTRLSPPSPTPSLMKTVIKTQPLTASSDNFIDLKTGLPIQEILVKIQDGSTLVRSDSLVTSFSLIENDTIYHLSNIAWDFAQAFAKYRGADMNPGSSGMSFPFVEQNDVITGTTVGLGVTNRAGIKGYNFLDLTDIEGAPIPTAPMDSFKLKLTCGSSAGGSPIATVILRQRVG